jgi:hypothetical protein
MTRTSAWTVVDRRIARRLRIDAIADAVVALTRPMRRKCGLGLERQDQRSDVRGGFDKGATRLIGLAFSGHAEPAHHVSWNRRD